MKKFISMVMTAAMVASLAPATAFAEEYYGDVKGSVKVVDALELTADEARSYPEISETHYGTRVPELKLDITSASYRETEGKTPIAKVTLSLDNAWFKNGAANNLTDKGDIADYMEGLVSIYDNNNIEILPGQGSAAVPPTPETPGTWAAGAASATSVAVEKVVADTGKVVPGDVVKDAANCSPAAAGFDSVLVDVWNGSNGGADTFTVAAAGNTNGTTLTKGGVDKVIVVPNGTDFNTETPAPKYNDAAVKALLKEGYTFKSGANELEYGGGKVNAFNTRNTKVDVFTAEVAKANEGKNSTDNDYLVVGTYAGYVPAAPGTAAGAGVDIEVLESDLGFDRNGKLEEVTYTFRGRFAKDWYLIFDMDSILDKTGEGRKATVSVSSEKNFVAATDLVYVSIMGRGITATTRNLSSVAEEEIIELESDIRVKSSVGKFSTGTSTSGQRFELKLSKGFEFSKAADRAGRYEFGTIDGNTVVLTLLAPVAPENEYFDIDAEDIAIEATSAKSGAVCTLTIKAWDETKSGHNGGDPVRANTFAATTSVEIMKVVDYKVVLSVDEDEDVPVIYSGVNVDNYGITDDSDHMSVEVTAKETFPGAWSMRKGFNFELPEHVYVTDVDVIDTENFYLNGPDNGITVQGVKAAFWNAYQDGSHVNFEFKKRVFDDVDSNLRDKECAEMTFKLELVADPGFEGDVVLKLTGELVDEQEVTIAKFVKPYEVKAEQNDLIIDYRYTDIPTAITITEAEAGLWAKNEATFKFFVERQDYVQFEDDPTFEIDSKSGLEIKDDKASGGTIQFTVKSESDEVATVTMKDMQLFMQRSIPAGPYDLKIGSTLAEYYEGQTLWAPDYYGKATVNAGNSSVIPADNLENIENHDGTCDAVHNNSTFIPVTGGANAAVKPDSYVGCVADYSTTVKEAFVNVVTAGRDQDDASFTTKVVVPVGENYIVAGEKQIELDTPAYINAAGYTMLPIRAVAVALGINSNNVLWDQPTKTVTILYGQRIITMTQGQKVVYVNGSAIPASAAVENTNSRTFLPMRDLATALGVTDITWDQATRTATLNGNQK